MARLKERLTAGRFTDRPDLSVPRGGARMGPHYDPDAFGKFAEGLARFLGTGRFLVAQTVIVFGWIVLNGGGLGAHPALPAPGALRRPADPAGPEPPGRPGPGQHRAGPRGGRPDPGRHRVPGSRAGRGPAGPVRRGDPPGPGRIAGPAGRARTPSTRPH